MRVLVIDDDEQMRKLLRQVMEWAGYEVMEAEDGRAGMKMQQKLQADLVITDLIMPEQEGLETITALKNLYPAVLIIPIWGGDVLGLRPIFQQQRNLGQTEYSVNPLM